MFRRIGTAAAIAFVLTLRPLRRRAGNFVPDWTFKGSTLDGWHAARAGRLEGG